MAINKKIILIVGLILFFVCGGFLIKNYPKNLNFQKQNCQIQTEELIVKGTSLSPIIEPDDTIKVFLGYYHCHEVERDDIVAYDYAGNNNPIIKIVKGIPGDKFELKNNGSGWNILINGKILKNSEGQPYIISGSGYKMLSLYANDYPIIPKDAYLILSNLITGGLDSTHFGLVNKIDIFGKVAK